MVVSDLQKARSRSIAAISVLDRRHFVRTRHNFRHDTHARAIRVARVLRMASRRALQSRLSLDKKISETSIKIIKNEVGCRDDTVPKTVDTRSHCEEE